jgi:hypothetical protein
MRPYLKKKKKKNHKKGLVGGGDKGEYREGEIKYDIFDVL